MQLLRTILIIIVAYYLIKLFMRYVAPFLIRYFVRKAQMQEHKPGANRSGSGGIHVKNKGTHTGNKESLGEYVDYEEITEEKSNTSNHE